MAITGTITLLDGTQLEIDDTVIVEKSLSITASSTPFSDFKLGTFTSARMKIKIFDESALMHDFAGAVIRLSEIEGENVTPLGVYNADGKSSQRQGDIVSLTAYDAALKFDKEIDRSFAETNYVNAFYAAKAACGKVGIVLSNADFSEFPNNNIMLSGASAQIQTYRDYVMWVAQMVCANVVINTDNKAEFRRVKYKTAEDGETIIADHEITGDMRLSVTFSDVRAYVKYISAYVCGKAVNFTSSYTSTDGQARPAEMELPSNPIINIMNEATGKQININWLSYIDSFKQRAVKAKLFSKSDIKIGDTCRFSGGVIDVRKSIIGVVTAVKWNYHGFTEIECAAPALKWED